MGNFITNFFKNMFGKLDCRILMVGLDAAGKTTILYYFKLGGELVHTLPTIGFNVESVHYKNLEFTVWDIGGQDRIRALWRLYYQETESIIYVVDSNDRERIKEARVELYKLLKEEDLQESTLLIYANKQDLPDAMSTTEITEKLGLHGLRNRNWYVQATSAVKGDGLYQGLEWLSREVRNKKKKSMKYS